jgi:2-methylcitrate dehydratase PrpD
VRKKICTVLGERGGAGVFRNAVLENADAEESMSEVQPTGTNSPSADTPAGADHPSGAVERAAASPPRPLHQPIAQFVLDAKFADLPGEVVEKAKAQIAYLLGLAFSGYYNYETDIVHQVLGPLEQGTQGATVIGQPGRLAAADAAFANGVMMRAWFLDDVLFPNAIHAGAITLPAALAVGDLARCSGRELLLVMAVAYEVMGKLGREVNVWEAPGPRRPTMIFGGYGPVVAAGRLLGLSAGQLVNALGYAANLCMGVPEQAQMDHFYGFFSRNGVLSALLARAGGAPYSGYTLEGKLGLYASFFGRVPPNLPQAVAKLGTRWEILSAEYKRYHTTGTNTVGIELLLGLMRKHRLTAPQVVRVRVALPESRRARHENFTVGPFASPMAAYSSMPYALARALLEGRVEADQYTESQIRNPVVLDAIRRFEFVFEDRPTRYVRLEVITRQGATHVAEIDSLILPFPRSDWGPWLRKDGERLVGRRAVLELEQQILNLEQLPDITAMIANLRPAPLRRRPHSG